MEEIDLKELFTMFWGKKVFIIIVIILFALIGVFYTKFLVQPEYMSTATLVLTKNDNNGSTITQTEVTLNQQLVATYTELIKTSNILKQVIENLGYDNINLSDLRKDISVKLVTSTQLIEISVKNTDPEIARNLTNELSKVFIERVKDIYKLENIHIVDEAKVASEPYNVNNVKNVLIFTIIGIIVSFGAVFVMNLFDTTIKSTEEVEKRLELTVLAAIPQYDYEMKKKGKK